METYIIVTTASYILSNAFSAWIYYVLSENKTNNRAIFIACAIVCIVIALLIFSNAVFPRGSSLARYANDLLFGNPGLVFWLVAIYLLNIPASWLAIRRNMVFQGVSVLILLVVSLFTLLFILVVFLILSGLT